MAHTPSAFTAEYSGAWVFYALRGVDRASGVDRRIAWIPPPGDPPPVALTLVETWARRGTYVFLGRSSANDGLFLHAFRSWLETAGGKGVRLVWLADPNVAPDQWAPACVRCHELTGTGGTVAQRARLALRNYAIVLRRGCTVRVDDGAARLLVAAPDGLAPGILLDVDRRGSVALDPQVVTVDLRGPGAGSLGIALRITATDARSPLDVLDIGCRYFYPASSSATGAEWCSLRYPIFAPGADLRLRGTLDLHAPLARSTRLELDSDGPALPSCFRTVLGAPIALQPRDGAALCFASTPIPLRGPAAGPLYLSVTGPFGLGAGSDVAFEGALLCGTSGAEYVEVTREPATLSFIAGQPAYAPLFDPGSGPDDGDPIDAPRLCDRATTSWVALTAATPLRYFAQPGEGVFYGHASPAAEAAADPAGLLSFFSVPAGRLPDESAPPGALPLVPYAGVEPGEAAAARRFEREVLSQERRQIVYELTRAVEGPPASPRAAPLMAEERLTAVTPAGFLATFSADRAEWESLAFACRGDDRLAFERLTDPLRSALLTNRQFLVISDAAAIANHFAEHNRLTLAGWRFDLSPGQWARHGTIAIVKSCDAALSDLVQDVGAWTLAEAFNRSPELTQRELLALIDDARARATSTPAYDHFVHTVLDEPRWNGVLFLRCSVPPGELPADLRDLAAGLDLERFVAHHLGVDQTPITGSLQVGDSSLFGLIAYEDSLRTPGASGRDGYDFQVLEMQVQFANSAVREFSARVAITLGRLFGAAATLTGSPAPGALQLTGSYQRQGERDAYVFRNTTGASFDIHDRTLRQVQITRAELASLTLARAADSTVRSRFGLSGSLAFHALTDRDSGQPFDLLGYDRLPFSGLALEMSFPADAPAAVSFRFDASRVRFDGSGAVARDSSLARHFPIEPLRAICSDAADRPTSLGFMTVTVPAIDATALGPEWYGVVFDLNLGTPGALASNVGFTGALALAWSPSRASQPFFAGLRLPGSTGASTDLSLMGVLKLSIHQTQLLAAGGAFLIKLTGMTMKVMGQALPPGATFDFFMFGDPDGSAGSTSLGWYGAFKKPRGDGGEERPAGRASPRGRPWAGALGSGGRAERDPPRS